MSARRQHQPLDEKDGYYFRDSEGELHGPLSRFEYEVWSLRGEISSGTKVWRQQAGTTYSITISRRFRWRKLCTIGACGALTEWATVCMTFGALIFLASVPKLRNDLAKELSGHFAQIFFFVGLLTATVCMTLATMRKLCRRVTKETTDIFESEV